MLSIFAVGGAGQRRYPDGDCGSQDRAATSGSYRKAMPKDAAIRELHASAGTQFDPGVVSALVAELG